MAFDDVKYRADQRVVGYVRRGNKAKLAKLATKNDFSLSRALDYVLTVFFEGKK